MKRDTSIYLKDVLENMRRAERFIKGMTYAEFVEDEKTHYAVMRCIEVMGEAVKHVPGSIRQRYPQIPWNDIAGMRDKVIHFYHGVNLERVWLVVNEDIPQLQPLIQGIMQDLKES